LVVVSAIHIVNQFAQSEAQVFVVGVGQIQVAQTIIGAAVVSVNTVEHAEAAKRSAQSGVGVIVIAQIAGTYTVHQREGHSFAGRVAESYGNVSDIVETKRATGDFFRFFIIDVGGGRIHVGGVVQVYAETANFKTVTCVEVPFGTQGSVTGGSPETSVKT